MSDAVNSPAYYMLPNGVETIQVSQWLSSLGGQAVQYVVRATRIDGVVKEDPIQDIDKAIFLLRAERDRLALLESQLPAFVNEGKVTAATLPTQQPTNTGGITP